MCGMMVLVMAGPPMCAKCSRMCGVCVRVSPNVEVRTDGEETDEKEMGVRAGWAL